MAINGRPGVGKSAVQKVLEAQFNIRAVDDGQVIRQHCMELFDLTEEDVTTQDGKRRKIEIEGAEWEVRKVLGEYGADLERTFGSMTVPNVAIRKVRREIEEQTVDIGAPIGYSFGSCRRDQARAYIDAGDWADVVILEITRPGIELSGNDFDLYDQSLVTHTYYNHRDTLPELYEDFVSFFEGVMTNICMERKAA